MGVRIDLYAVDVPAFAVRIDQSIGATLWEYAENGSDRAIAIDWNDQANNRRYRAVPGEPVACLEQGCWARLSKDGTAEVEFLRRTMRDYLGQESSYALLSLLRALSRCPNTAFVREISVRNRRWWIGSLLNYAECSGVFSHRDYERFVFLCQKILHGISCGKTLPDRAFAPADACFPVIPKDDADLKFGIWSEDETEFALGFLRRVEEQQPRFQSATRAGRNRARNGTGMG